jgi:hypothetical protein
MKITRYLYLIFIIGLYAINYFFLKIKIFPFTGIVLATLIVLVIAINVYVKLKNKSKGLHSEDFIFSPEVAQTLKKVDIGIQYESSIISIFFLIIGLMLFTIYTVFFTQYNTVMKVFVAFNSIFAMALMGSMLITNYQQFVSYRESTKMFAQFTDKVGSEIISQKNMNDILNTDNKPPSLGVPSYLEIPTTKERNLGTCQNHRYYPEDDVVDLTDKEMLEKLFEGVNKDNKDNNQIERRDN